MSSPARSSVSASNAVMGDESPFLQFHEDIVSAQDCKLEAMAVLKSDVMAALHKEVKSLDEDSWMFSGPRSKIHLVSRPRILLAVSAYLLQMLNMSSNQEQFIIFLAPNFRLQWMREKVFNYACKITKGQVFKDDK